MSNPRSGRKSPKSIQRPRPGKRGKSKTTSAKPDSKQETNSEFDDVKSFITKNGHSIFQALSEVDMMSGSQKNFFNLKRMLPGFYK